MNRRTFLICGSGALWAQDPPSRQIVVGLIGAGARGMQLLKILLSESSVRIGAVCETYEPRMFGAVGLARSQGHRTRYYRIYRDLLSDRSLDAVVIATPDFWHCRMTIEALEQQKAVYVEQPLCRTWQEGVAMMATQRRSQRVVQVGSQRRSSAFYAELAARRNRQPAPVQRIEARAASSYLLPGILKRGPTKLPEPLNFEDWQAAAETRVEYSPDRFLNWRFYSSYGGGSIADLGAPLLDGVHMVAGVSFPVTVMAHGENSKYAGFDTAERAKVEVEYPGGIVASMSIDGASPRPGDAASIRGHRERIEVNATAAGDATRMHLAEFLTCVRSGAAPSAPPDVVFPATLICQMANLSIATGHKVRWISAESRVEDH
ncbi:MAG TPA: Gfo/Idh/MocA family oxidoreductase [Bryobacteraceae bacterium]|nr:Gfo/Idh/MocA family oxidoreductase [Bryobacteraceae bacterium]